MSNGAGKRAGSRRAETAPRQSLAPLLLWAAGATLAVIAWGWLVWLAIDFGRAARGGETPAWAFMAIACLGAVACLFLCLMLIARTLAALGLTRSAQQPTSGGRRRK